MRRRRARSEPAPSPRASTPARPDATPTADATIAIPACLTPGVYRLAFAKDTAWEPYHDPKASCAPARPAPVFLRLSVPRTGWVGAAEVRSTPPHAPLGTELIVAMGGDCEGQLTLERDDLDFTGLATFGPGEIRLAISLARISRKDAMATVECRAADLRLVATRIAD